MRFLGDIPGRCAAFALALAAAGAGCYGPSPAEGLPCSESGACPDGQECGADNICRRAGEIPPDIDAEVCPVSSCEVEVLAGGLFTADAIAVGHPDYVFWISASSRTVFRTSKTDGATAEIDSGAAPYAPHALTADASRVYWTDNRTSGAILSRAADGGDKAGILVGGQDFPLFVALDGGQIYWTNGGGLVLRADAAGGGLSMVAASQGGDGPGGQLVLDESRVYFADTGGGYVFAIAKDGSGALTVVSANQGAPLGVAVDGEHAYWANSGSGEIKRRSLAGGLVELVADGQPGASFVAVGPHHVYWANRDDGRVMSADKATLAPRVVAEGQDGPYALALDGDALYWVNLAGANRLLRTYPCGCR